MGDRNAVDIAHQTHVAILESEGCISPGEAVHYRGTVPPGKVWEMLYIDDQWCLAVVPACPWVRAVSPELNRLRGITEGARQATPRRG